MFKRWLLGVATVGTLVATIGACGSSQPAASADGGTASVDGGAPVDDAGAQGDPIPALADLDTLLDALRDNRDAAMLEQSREQGWPAPVDGGYLFVSTGGLSLVAGDHDNWAGTELTAEGDFHWIVLPIDAGNRYKFTDGGENWVADPWSRSFAWDDMGEMSTVSPNSSHLERFFQLGNADLLKRTVRIWVPAQPATHLLYAHDGQNLFNPYGPYGGWHMNDAAPAGLMIVGIDATDERTWEYTYTTEPGAGGPVGGGGDIYASFVQETVRALVRRHYGEPAKVGVIGSSFGGIMSLHMADRYPGAFDFVASLSGTVDWGSWAGSGTDTMIHRYVSAGHRDTAIYIDSGGNGSTCSDSDGDGTNDDDSTETDSYCVNLQLRDALLDLGYVEGTDLWHHWEPDALHNEEAWAARVFRPLQNFMAL